MRGQGRQAAHVQVLAAFAIVDAEREPGSFQERFPRGMVVLAVSLRQRELETAPGS